MVAISDQERETLRNILGKKDYPHAMKLADALGED
jgi:hypothetical protein